MNVPSKVIQSSQKKQPKCPSVGECGKQIKCGRSLCSGTVFSHEKNKLLAHATTWMNLENIMLSERNQTQKMTYYVIPLI